MTATGNPDDDRQGRPEAGQPEEAPPPPQWLSDGEQPGGAAPLLPEPAPLPPFGSPLPDEPEQDTNRTVSDLDVSGMRTQIFKKDDEAPAATGAEPPPLPPFPGAEGEAGGAGESPDHTVADSSAWTASPAGSPGPAGPADPPVPTRARARRR
ncbi:hypothetical protein BJF79_37405 [Actinomadura sp. CNU-125]|uniref:hypothetical protein n=1 Tax=Actinomadura sp. CNU-125 TaxID=1904961 RepID=UPI0009678B5D|nr:hypothetical protein [Actinomadura sp. CNU-125]OLT31375.1 hypothetical protein BJF79_37405 [Actinomadura sp. CNU-125]